MGRRRRVEFEGALYHVWTRGNNKQQIFMDDADRNDFLDALTEIFAREGVLLFAFCLMDNHVHLLVETRHTPLNRAMRGLLTRYARTFNRRHGRVGHLFQGRYHASLCEEESYRLELLRYIHLNPVRAGLVDAPEDWRWSSHRAYLGKAEFPALTFLPILEEFGADLPQAREAFARFVQDGLAKSKDREFRFSEIKLDGTLFGSGSFHKRVRSLKKKPRRRSGDEIRGKRRIMDVIETVAANHELTPGEILGPGRNAFLARARREILFSALDAGWPQAAIARAMKKTDSWAAHIRSRYSDHEAS